MDVENTGLWICVIAVCLILAGFPIMLAMKKIQGTDNGWGLRAVAVLIIIFASTALMFTVFK